LEFPFCARPEIAGLSLEIYPPHHGLMILPATDGSQGIKRQGGKRGVPERIRTSACQMDEITGQSIPAAPAENRPRGAKAFPISRS